MAPKRGVWVDAKVPRGPKGAKRGLKEIFGEGGNPVSQIKTLITLSPVGNRARFFNFRIQNPRDLGVGPRFFKYPKGPGPGFFKKGGPKFFWACGF